MSDYIARPGKDKNQPLSGHLKGVSELAGKFGEKFGLEKTGKLSGETHDVGKYGDTFQDYIKFS
ncbi:MAG: hypothetical protein LBD73_07575 [Deferribacteraceae bacterium]|nr:hypothetical protein [Deferribacteraceae bacterium]